MNYLGPDEGEGIQVYIDGVLAVVDTGRDDETKAATDGKVVIGRRFSDRDYNYGEAIIDELMMFNQALSQQQVQDLYQSYLAQTTVQPEITTETLPDLPVGVNLIRYWSFDTDNNIGLNNGAMIVDEGKVSCDNIW